MTKHKSPEGNEALNGSHSSRVLLREILGVVQHKWSGEHRGPLQQYAQGNKKQQADLTLL